MRNRIARTLVALAGVLALTLGITLAPGKAAAEPQNLIEICLSGNSVGTGPLFGSNYLERIASGLTPYRTYVGECRTYTDTDDMRMKFISFESFRVRSEDPAGAYGSCHNLYELRYLSNPGSNAKYRYLAFPKRNCQY